VSHRAWLVDLDGTLYHAAAVKLAMALELAAAGTQTLGCLRRFRSEHERLRRELREPVTDAYALQLAAAARACELPPEELAARVEEWMIRRPGKWIRIFRRRQLLAEIARFRSAGGSTALVSDYPAREKLRAMAATALFDAVVANGEPAAPPRLKPWPDGYLMAAGQLGVAPSECLVIGDRPDADGDAARRAGMDFRLVR
jgi:FMN phosphatase YigB (HAD superfamily)